MKRARPERARDRIYPPLVRDAYSVIAVHRVRCCDRNSERRFAPHSTFRAESPMCGREDQTESNVERPPLSEIVVHRQIFQT